MTSRTSPGAASTTMLDSVRSAMPSPPPDTWSDATSPRLLGRRSGRLVATVARPVGAGYRGWATAAVLAAPAENAATARDGCRPGRRSLVIVLDPGARP